MLWSLSAKLKVVRIFVACIAMGISAVCIAPVRVRYMIQGHEVYDIVIGYKVLRSRFAHASFRVRRQNIDVSTDVSIQLTKVKPRPSYRIQSNA